MPTQRHTLFFDPDRCLGDRLCMDICPVRVIGLGEGGLPRVKEDAAGRCIGCGHCVAVCPAAAIALDGVSPDDLLPDPGPGARGLDRAALELFFKSRRSIRHFTDQAVSPETLATALDWAAYAPSGKNRQVVAWVVLNSPEAVQRLAAGVADWMRPKPEFARIVESFERGRDPILRHAPCAAFAHAPGRGWLDPLECAIQASYLELALHGLGLGSCWAGFALQALADDPALAGCLGLGPDRAVLAGLMIGHPAVRYRRAPWRGAQVAVVGTGAAEGDRR